MKQITPKLEYANEYLLHRGILSSVLGIILYLVNIALAWDGTLSSLIPGVAEFFFLINGIALLLKRPTLSREIIESYAIRLDHNKILFPEMDFPSDAPEENDHRRKTNFIELDNIKSIKVVFGKIVIKRKQPEWAGKISIPAYYFSRDQRTQILTLVKAPVHI